MYLNAICVIAFVKAKVFKRKQSNIHVSKKQIIHTGIGYESKVTIFTTD